MLYDFTSNESMANIQNFGLAVNKRVFNIANVTVRGPHLDLKTLKAHIILAKLITVKANNHCFDFKTLDPAKATLVKYLMAIGCPMVTQMLNFLFDNIGEEIKNFIDGVL